MNQKSRTYNSIFNSVIGIVSAIFNVALNFFVRIVIVRTMGEEINGLHSLFQNIINIMAVVETSMCTAMIIHLYEPVKHNDVNELSCILSFYNKIYRVLAIGFLIVGVFFNLFLGKIITTNIPMRDTHMYFFIFTLSVSLNYLTYVYRIVLFAEQKNRISAMATLIGEIVFRGGAALTAIFLQNYTVFLICYIGEKLFGNLLCRFYVKKEHMGISSCVKGIDNIEFRTRVMRTVKPLLISRLADIVQNSSQSILISILLGNIAVVGYYGNYALVTGSVGLLFSQLGSAFTSSFGNLATERNKEKMYSAYRKSDFIISSIAIVICSGFLACIQDFISFVFGPNFLLGNISVIILTFTMFVTLLNIPTISVQNAMGRHDVDVKNMIIQAIVSVIGGYVGGSIFGMDGLLVGMLIPMLIFTIICKNILIHRLIFKKHIKEILSNLMIPMLKGIVIFAIVIFITFYVDTGVILLDIFLKGIVTIFVSIAMIILLSIKNPYLKSTVNIILHFKKQI